MSKDLTLKTINGASLLVMSSLALYQRRLNWIFKSLKFSLSFFLQIFWNNNSDLRSTFLGWLIVLSYFSIILLQVCEALRNE